MRYCKAQLYGVDIGQRPRSVRAERTNFNRNAVFNPHPDNLTIPQFPRQAMQTCRRTFATSVARLGRNGISTLPKTSGPAVLRCSQLLQESKKTGTSSFEEKEIRINGTIRSVRKQKRFAFAQISDGSTVEPLQAFLTPAQASR